MAKKTKPSLSKQSVSNTLASIQNANKGDNNMPKSFWYNSKMQAIALFIFSFMLYANTLTHDYCQDDAIVITDNMFTTQGISGISGIMGYDTFYGFFKEAGKANLVAGGRYRPFTLVMFAIEYQIFGKNPFIGHLMNIIWFGITCVVLYFLLLKLLQYRTSTDDNAALFIAFMTALLFAAHPVHTEAVANIKGRDEIMTLLGSLGAVWFSLKYYESKAIKNAIWVFVLFFIGLLSKENAITFVIIAPLMYLFFIKTDFTTALKHAIPFVGAAVIFLILRGGIIGNQFTGEQNELMNNPFLKLVNNQYIPFEVGEKLATIIYTLGKYIQLLVIPYPLTHDYYPRHVDIMQFSDWQVLASIVVYIALIGLILRGWQKRDLISFGVLFFLLTLSIVSNVVFPVGTNMAERFIFMPSVGFCFVLAVILLQFLKKQAVNVAIGLALIMGVMTFMRNFDWKDNYTIFTTDVKVSQNSAKLQCSAGGTKIEKAANEMDAQRKKQLLSEAITHLRRSLEIHPQFKNPYLLLGNAYIYLEDYDKAIEEYQNGLKLDPEFRDVKTNIAMAYREKGRIYGQKDNNLPKALEMLEKAVFFNPNDAQSYSFLGTVYGIAGQTDKAVSALEKALSIRFDKNDAMNLSVAYGVLGNTTKATEWRSRAGQ